MKTTHWQLLTDSCSLTDTLTDTHLQVMTGSDSKWQMKDMGIHLSQADNLNVSFWSSQKLFFLFVFFFFLRKKMLIKLHENSHKMCETCKQSCKSGENAYCSIFTIQFTIFCTKSGVWSRTTVRLGHSDTLLSRKIRLYLYKWVNFLTYETSKSVFISFAKRWNFSSVIPLERKKKQQLKNSCLHYEWKKYVWLCQPCYAMSVIHVYLH